jgi:hypothetical protein
MNSAVDLSHLLPPSFQVAINSEFRFQTSEARNLASEALMALIAASGREVIFKVTEPNALSDFLSDRACFKLFGELLGNSKSPRSSVQERNSGFGVGDILVVREGAKLRHMAIWLDQDLYFEAQSFGQSVFFRVATFNQLVQELVLRSEVDTSIMSFLALRRKLPWADVAKRYRNQTNKAARLGLIRLAEDEKGQSFVAGSEGIDVKRHQLD